MGPACAGLTRLGVVGAVALAATVAQVTVPSVVGSPWQRAGLRLHALGLRVVDVRVTSKRSRGTVVWQRPRAGTAVAAGARVRLGVANVSFVSVPNVVGLQEDDARARLRAVGLEPAVVSVHSLSQVASVVAQHPAPGVDVARSSRVTISVSGGPGP